MALTVAQSPNATIGEKAFAGGYLVAEGAAHGALVVGTAGLACAAVGPACAAPVEAALGIGAAGEIALSDKLGQNVWQMGLADRGNAIEDALGRNLSHTFEAIDKFDSSTGIVTSIKSINLATKSYQTFQGIWSRVAGYVQDVAGYTGGADANISITQAMIRGRELLLAIPPDASQAQLDMLQQLQTWAAQMGVTVTIQVVK
jgi:hypothetical protein